MKTIQTLFALSLALIAGMFATSLLSGCQKPTPPPTVSTNKTTADVDVSIPGEPAEEPAAETPAEPSEPADDAPPTPEEPAKPKPEETPAEPPAPTPADEPAAAADKADAPGEVSAKPSGPVELEVMAIEA